METNTLQSENELPKKSLRVSRLPVREEDLKNLAKKALLSWKNSGLTLLWKTPEAFEKDIQAYEEILTGKAIELGDKKPMLNEFQKLDKEIDGAVTHVKNFLAYHKGKENNKAWYEVYGIKKVSSSYKFPIDRDARLQSLRLMVNAITQNPPEPDGYGLAYWQEALRKYEDFLNQVGQAQGSISGKVKNKNNLKKEVQKVLRSLGKLIEAHHPDDYEAVLREWGFQREMY